MENLLFGACVGLQECQGEQGTPCARELGVMRVTSVSHSRRQPVGAPCWPAVGLVNQSSAVISGSDLLSPLTGAECRGAQCLWGHRDTHPFPFSNVPGLAWIRSDTCAAPGEGVQCSQTMLLEEAEAAEPYPAAPGGVLQTPATDGLAVDPGHLLGARDLPRVLS